MYLSYSCMSICCSFLVSSFYLSYVSSLSIHMYIYIYSHNRCPNHITEAERLLSQHGRNELPEKHVSKWVIFGQLLIQPMPCMIWVAAFIELCIENYLGVYTHMHTYVQIFLSAYPRIVYSRISTHFLDMGILLFIQFANASIAFYETTKAADAVSALKNSLKPIATVKRDGVMKQVNTA